MFKLFRNISLAIVMIVSLAGCSKWLDLEPQDGIIKEKYWKTKEQVQAAVIGIYSSLLASPTDGTPLAETFWIWGEARAEMVTPTAQATSDEQAMVNVNTLPTNSLTRWDAIYETINYCNTVLQLAPGVKDLDPTFTQEQLDAALSEALTIRSLMYFYLVRNFRDVPLKLTATLSDEDISPIAKSDADVVLKQIVEDLKKAEPGAVTSYGNQASNKGRVTKYTINALLADVYLWMNDYTNCITECDKIINSGQFGLLPNDGALFNSLYVDGNSVESIFEFQFDAQKTNTFYRMFYQSRRWTASTRTMEYFFMLDDQAADSADLRGNEFSYRESGATIWKFIGLTSSNARGAAQSYAHWIVYRYSDILLLKAEALNELGRGTEALDLVYRVRRRSQALSITDPSPTNKTEIGDFILEERGRELAFEGKRWYDILRFAKRQYATRPDFLSSIIISAVPSDRQQSVITKYRDQDAHYLPIHFEELQTNKLLVQNPFYK